MKIQVIDCNYLFISFAIDVVKDHLTDFHMGFMVVNDKLYLPYYQVLKCKYNLPEHYKTTIIDLDNVTKFDCLATYFYKVNGLGIDDVIDLYDSQSNFEELLNTVGSIAESRYDLGYSDCYED